MSLEVKKLFGFEISNPNIGYFFFKIFSFIKTLQLYLSFLLVGMQVVVY
jgi:hypothetical protein